MKFSKSSILVFKIDQILKNEMVTKCGDNTREKGEGEKGTSMREKGEGKRNSLFMVLNYERERRDGQ